MSKKTTVSIELFTSIGEDFTSNVVFNEDLQIEDAVSQAVSKLQSKPEFLKILEEYRLKKVKNLRLSFDVDIVIE